MATLTQDELVAAEAKVSALADEIRFVEGTDAPRDFKGTAIVNLRVLIMRANRMIAKLGGTPYSLKEAP